MKWFEKVNGRHELIYPHIDSGDGYILETYPHLSEILPVYKVRNKYWTNVRSFVHSIEDVPMHKLSDKQRDWLAKIIFDLREPYNVWKMITSGLDHLLPDEDLYDFG